ncbi:unnamed protein product [Bursaphelenchus okinawaensis]|uniref:Uncharacterized protein n=1 Tax=Bursaphelenchus okinawaensis TaxID=465554 RepID=A0A811LLE5_9BILA|nr:unnamed protein product [Bursaphelenchus okinawaensis]CAG9125293.1 unnamed protein product [Bursaphelenchus okinawaensis]
MDFRSLCYKNVVYRLNGETWAKAFLCTNQRTLAMAEWRSEEKFSRFITCCPYTGTLAMVLKYNKLLITKLDFGQKIFKCVNSFHERIHGDLHKVQLINKATQMIVQTNTSFIVYDLMDDRIAKVYERINLHSYNANTLCYNDGTLVDLCNQKEYKVQLSFPVTFILNIDLYGYIKYIGYWNDQKEFVLIENATGQHYVLFSSNSLYETSSIRVFSCLNQVMMQGDNTRIYKIKTGDCVFKNFPYRAGIDYKMQGMDGMHLLHNNKLIGYCKRKKGMERNGNMPLSSE